MTAPSTAEEGGRDHDPALPRVKLTQVLEEHHAALREEAERWLEWQHRELCSRVEAAVGGKGSHPDSAAARPHFHGGYGGPRDSETAAPHMAAKRWHQGAANCAGGPATSASVPMVPSPEVGGHGVALAREAPSTVASIRSDATSRSRGQNWARRKQRTLIMTESEHFRASLEPGTLRWHLNRVLEGKAELIIGIAIFMSTLAMVVQLELNGRRADASFVGSSAPMFDALESVLQALTHIFNAIFSVELLIRFYVLRLAFFRSAFNNVDFLVVMFGLVDAYILTLVGLHGQSLSFVRMLRFVRLARTLRVIRTMGMFRQLRVLLNTIAISFGSLFWSMLTLFLFMLMGALLLCQVSQDFVVDETGDADDRAWVSKHYGTSSRALYTMFEVTFSGCWPNYARRLIDGVSVWYAAFFVCYVTTVVFAMVRIISALFLKDTLQIASRDSDSMIYEKMQETKAVRGNLLDLFKEADKNGNGQLDWEEFCLLLNNRRVRAWFSTLGLNAEETESLFEALADGDNKIGLEEFCSGIFRLKGSVRPQDVMRIQRDCQRILEQCRMMNGAVFDMVQKSSV